MSNERRLQPAVEVEWARQCERPVWMRDHKPRGAKAAGMRYEQQVQEYVAECVLGRADLRLLASPWFEFKDRSGRRWCQPDVVLLNADRAVGIIIEVKLKHTADAWWQLQEVYRPVLRAAYPAVGAWGLVEIVNWHDPLVRFPQQYDFTPDPLRVRSAARISVHIWNPRRARIQSARSGDCAGGGQAAGAGADAQGAEQLLAAAQS